MKCNPLGFFSLLALLGFLAFVDQREAFFGFFGFAYYFRYFFVVPDELFLLNLRRAASAGFFAGVGATALAVILRTLLPDLLSSATALASGFCASVVFFTLMLAYLEMKERNGAL